MLVGHANILMLYLVHPLSPLMRHVTLLSADTVQVRGWPSSGSLADTTFAKYASESTGLSSAFCAHVTVISVTPLGFLMASCVGSRVEKVQVYRTFLKIIKKQTKMYHLLRGMV